MTHTYKLTPQKKSKNWLKRFAQISSFLILLALILQSQHDSYALMNDGSSWPQVQGDAHRSGYVPQTLIGGKEDWTEQWRVNLPPVSYRVQAIIGNNQIYIPSNDGRIYAYSTANGSQTWTFPNSSSPPKAPFMASAAYASGRVFVGGQDGIIYALSSNDGSLLWQYYTGGTIRTAPLLAQNTLYIGSRSGRFLALDQTTGNELWSDTLPAPIEDTAAYDNGKVFFGAMDAKGYAYDATTGSQLWSIQTTGQGFRDRWTVAGNGVVFFQPNPQLHYDTTIGNSTNLHANDTMNPEGYPPIWNEPWDTDEGISPNGVYQREVIQQFLDENPLNKAVYVVDQETGLERFTAPITYFSGGGPSTHPQPVLLPGTAGEFTDGNAYVAYRRSFHSIPLRQTGKTTHEKMYVGKLILHGANQGDIEVIESCQAGASEESGDGGSGCGPYKIKHISDETFGMMATGETIFAHTARLLQILDTEYLTNPTITPSYEGIVNYNYDSPDSSTCTNQALVCFDNYYSSGTPGITGGGWRVYYYDLKAEVDTDGNDSTRPAAIVGNSMYILHYNTLVKLNGIIK